MELLLFALTLLLAVLFSDYAGRSVLSTTLFFLAAGVLAALTDVSRLTPDSPVLFVLAETALVAVLFTDGMRIGFRDLVQAWRLPSRALLLGLPLTLAGIAAAAHWVVGLHWLPAALVGAILCPTDPVFAAALVGSEKVPRRLRDLLNVESGFNDGLALPAVLILLGSLHGGTGPTQAGIGKLAVHLALGVAAGLVIPCVTHLLLKIPLLQASRLYEPLHGFAVILLIYAATRLLHANVYLAAFTGGITTGSLDKNMRDQFDEFGRVSTELLKVAAVFVFGTLLDASFFTSLSAGAIGFAFLVIVAARPLALGLAFFATPLSRLELAAAAWFGPKGFASIVFGLLLLREHVPHAMALFHLVAIAIVASIVLHSSTDVLIAALFARHESAGSRQEPKVDARQ